jgi:hypothetical protein
MVTKERRRHHGRLLLPRTGYPGGPFPERASLLEAGVFVAAELAPVAGAPKSRPATMAAASRMVVIGDLPNGRWRK